MPHRMDVLSLLQSYSPKCSHERQALRACLNFIRSHDDCFLRSNLGGHVTASCWLLSPDYRQVLLTHHKKIGQWLQLGGHADGESNVLLVAIKEAQEESGIAEIEALSPDVFDVDIHHIAKHRAVPAHYHYDIRFALRAPHHDFKVSEESHALAWRPIENLLDPCLTNASIARMAHKWLNKKIKIIRSA